MSLFLFQLVPFLLTINVYNITPGQKIRTTEGEEEFEARGRTKPVTDFATILWPVVFFRG